MVGHTRPSAARLDARSLIVLVAMTGLACGSASKGATGTSSGAGGGSSSASSGAGGSGGAPVIGGSRPVAVQVPTGYTKGVPAPLLIMLHGYGIDGAVEEIYLQLAPVAAAKGYLYAHPNGTLDSTGAYFWNATDGCCNIDGSSVDDSAYLASVVADIQAHWSVDPKRIFFMGHSNGGYMTYRMACDHAGLIAATVSLAGAMWEDVAKCVPSSTVNVLEIHGDADTEVLYGGAAASGPGMGAYPGAVTTVQDWATLDGCSLAADTSSPPLDLDVEIPGAETTVATYAQGCKPGGSAALWTMHGGMHLPSVGATFREDVFAFFAAHPKP
jgi:polyhydroxybutyrate depolymerase